MGLAGSDAAQLLLEELDGVRMTREGMLTKLASEMLVRFPQEFRMQDLYESMAMKMLSLSGVEGVESADQFVSTYLSSGKESVRREMPLLPEDWWTRRSAFERHEEWQRAFREGG